MLDATDEERWVTWMVQAERFAQRENFTDALARAECVQVEVQAARARETNAARRLRLESYEASVDKQVKELRAQYQAWNSAIATRRQKTIDNAAEELARPLPPPADRR